MHKCSLVTHKKQKRYLDWLALQKELEYGDGNTQTRQAIIISTLKEGFHMEVCNTHSTKQYLYKH